MKKITTFLLILVGLFVFTTNLSAQAPGSPQYQMMKKSGQIVQPAQAATPIEPISTITALNNSNRDGSGFWVPLDGTFTLAMQPNDDGSSALITLPFDFCFYGDTHNSLYINNNGNISFDNTYNAFSSTGFPVNGYAMIAPFWADVDTYSCGSVWYKIESNRIIIIWDAVGYFGQQCDKLNTFELIMTDGTDATIGTGNNVGFAYEDMQWTTGSASGGTNGFGGTPATVGINKGDGTTYALVGRFDHPGTDYDGPGGNADGVDWLDNQRFTFDGCAGYIPPPPPASIPISDWALYFGIFLIALFIVLRYRRRLA